MTVTENGRKRAVHDQHRKSAVPKEVDSRSGALSVLFPFLSESDPVHQLRWLMQMPFRYQS